MVWEYLTVAAVAFAVGFVAGFYAGAHLRDATSRQMLLYVTLFVTLVWGASVITGIYTSHEPSTLTHGTMGAVAGYAFKEYRRRERERTPEVVDDV